MDSTPNWVTETNCNWDGDEPDGVAQCERVTGQQAATHGIGSINTLIEMDTIDRIAWWWVTNEQVERAMTMNARLTVLDSAELLPPGRALVNN